jgi:hypothetical protein
LPWFLEQIVSFVRLINKYTDIISDGEQPFYSAAEIAIPSFVLS